ncbi:MAG TPA: hypothetical protein PLD52_10665, partial [Bacteroidales bacterium]|nr:hypothetical protein [Bacteroidales bacterium]
MKKILLFVAVVFTGLNGFSQKPLFADQPKDSVVHLDPRMQQFDYVPGEILIRYKDDVQVQNLKTGNIVQTGLATIDSLFFRYRISDQQKLFPAEQKLKSKVMLRSFNGKEFEKPSLHNIYKLTLPQESNMFQAIEELKKDSNIVYAEPNYILSITHDKAVSPLMTEKDLVQLAAGKLPGISNTSPFPLPGAHYPVTLPVNPPDPKSIPNDPLYPQQWYIPAVHADAVWD